MGGDVYNNFGFASSQPDVVGGSGSTDYDHTLYEFCFCCGLSWEFINSFNLLSDEQQAAWMAEGLEFH